MGLADEVDAKWQQRRRLLHGHPFPDNTNLSHFKTKGLKLTDANF